MHIHFFALNKCSDVQKSSETVIEAIPNANIEAYDIITDPAPDVIIDQAHDATFEPSHDIIIDPACDVILDSAPDATIEKTISDHNDFQANMENHSNSQAPMKIQDIDQEEMLQLKLKTRV